MATGSLGTLSIDVLANIASMVSDLGKAQAESAKAAKEFQRQWEEATDGVKESFKSIAEFAGFALTVEGLKEVTSQALEAAEKVTIFSQVLGVSQQSLQTMSFAAGLTGQSFDTVTGSLARMERSAEQAAGGNVKMAAAFQSLGVSVSQLTELLGHPDELMKVLAEHTSQFGDGAGKAAATMTIFGRGAAEMIPFLDKMGSGMEELREKAEALGVVLSTEEQAKLMGAKEALNEAGEAAKGLGNQFALAVAPAIRLAAEAFTSFVENPNVKGFFHSLGDDLNQLIVLGSQIKAMVVDIATRFDTAFPQVRAAFKQAFSGMGGDVVSFVQEAQDTLSLFVLGAKNAWVLIQTGADVIWREIANGFNAIISGVLQSLAQIPAFEAQLYSKLGLDSLATRMNGVTDSLRNMAAGFQQIPPDLEASSRALAQNNAEYDAAVASHAEWAKGVRDSADALNHVSEAADGAHKPLVGFADALAASTGNLQSARDSAQALIDQLNGFGDQGMFMKAVDDYGKHIDEILKQYDEWIKKGMSVAEANENLRKAFDANDAAFQRQNDQMDQSLDVMDKLNLKFQEQIDSIKGATQQQEIEKQYLRDLAVYQQELNKVYGDGAVVTDEMKAKLYALAQQQQAQMEATKQSAQVLKDWVGIATNAFDSAFQAINKDIVEGGSVMKDLVNVAKQVVQAILLEFEKLAIINPLLKSIFGANAVGNLPTLDNAGGLIGQVFGGGSSPIGSLIGNVIGGGGGATATGTGGSGVFSGAVANGATSILGGGGGIFGSGSMVGGWLTSLFGSSATGAGGAGAFAGATAGASETGVLGTTGLGDAFGTFAPILGGAMAGYQLGGAGGALALGALSYAIPVVGWILGIASIVNSLTGGNVFGTSYKPTGVTGSNIDVTGSGVSIQDFYQEHKHGALFSGGSYKNVNFAAPQDQQDAYNQAFASEQAALEAAAKALGVTVGDEISGTWSEVTDKTGKVISQTTTILGQKFTEDAQHMFERLLADNELKLLGSQAQDIAKQWQSNADTLADGTAMLVAAQVDVNKGMSLLGSSDSSLADITDIVEKLQSSGESLVQTYVRLQVEQQSLADNLNLLGAATGKTGEDFVQLADDFTKAAGSVQNADALWATFFKEFYSAAEQTALKTAADKRTAAQLLTALGEDPNESMAQFKQDFLDKLPTLSGDQIAQWLQAGAALGAFTADVTSAATTLADAQQKYANYEVSTLGDAFTQSFVKILEAEQQQIDAANQLAQAAGLAGASQRDLAYITQQTSQQMAMALAQLAVGIQNDIDALYGAQSTSLTFDNGQVLNYQAIQQQQQRSAQQQHAKDVANAYDLIDKLGDYVFASGGNVNDTLKAFGLSPDEIAKTLGITDDQVQADIQAAADNAAALTKLVAKSDESNGLLQDILAAIQGKPLPFDISTLIPHEITKATVINGNGSGPRSVVTGRSINGDGSLTDASPLGSGSDAQPGDLMAKSITQPLAKSVQGSGDRVVAAIKENTEATNKLIKLLGGTVGTQPRSIRGTMLPGAYA